VPTRFRFDWTLRRSLAAAALALGALAMAGNPVRGHVVTIDTQELATIVGGEVDHVSPPELAGWIVRGATDYRLVDLRGEAEFAQYHIPTAENVPVAQLPDRGLARNEKIVLYSEGGIHSAQAWMLLRAQGYRGVYILSGGLEGWRDEVVFPVAPASPEPREAARFERAAQLARFFGGQPRAAGAADAGAPALVVAPPVRGGAPGAAPAGQARKGAPPAARKKKEGC
jgi:rhodanese-related sulfurtransferase